LLIFSQVMRLLFSAALKPKKQSSGMKGSPLSGAKEPFIFSETDASESLKEGSRCFDEAFEERVFTPLFGELIERIEPGTKRQV